MADNQTDDTTLNLLQIVWGRVHNDMMLLFWITSLAAKRQQLPNSDEARGLDSAEENFRVFCQTYDQNSDFRVDRVNSLLGITNSIIVDLSESRKKLGPVDRNKFDQRFANKFGSYDAQCEKFKIRIKLMNGENSQDRSQMTAFTILTRIRNSLSHGRYETEDSGITFRDQMRDGSPTAEFHIPAFNFLNYAYQVSCAFLYSLQELGLYNKVS